MHLLGGLDGFLNDKVADNKLDSDLKILREQYTGVKKDIKDRFEDKVAKIQQGDDLLPLSIDSKI